MYTTDGARSYVTPLCRKEKHQDKLAHSERNLPLNPATLSSLWCDRWFVRLLGCSCFQRAVCLRGGRCQLRILCDPAGSAGGFLNTAGESGHEGGAASKQQTRWFYSTGPTLYCKTADENLSSFFVAVFTPAE